MSLMVRLEGGLIIELPQVLIESFEVHGFLGDDWLEFEMTGRAPSAGVHDMSSALAGDPALPNPGPHLLTEGDSHGS